MADTDRIHIFRRQSPAAALEVGNLRFSAGHLVVPFFAWVPNVAVTGPPDSRCPPAQASWAVSIVVGQLIAIHCSLDHHTVRRSRRTIGHAHCHALRVIGLCLLRPLNLLCPKAPIHTVAVKDKMNFYQLFLCTLYTGIGLVANLQSYVLEALCSNLQRLICLQNIQNPSMSNLR